MLREVVMSFNEHIMLHNRLNLVLKTFEEIRKLPGDSILELKSLLDDLAATYADKTEDKAILLAIGKTLALIKIDKKGSMVKLKSSMLDDMVDLAFLKKSEVPTNVANRKKGWTYDLTRDAHWVLYKKLKYWVKNKSYANLPLEYYVEEEEIIKA